MRSEIIQGDCINVLRGMATESVQCVVTSPPYLGLRDYKVDGMIGLESTVDEYVAKMIEVFREVRRVLRKDGTLWLNLGDTYATGAGKVGECPGGGQQGERWAAMGPRTQPNRMPQPGLKPKDLCGVPWRVAFALQADGWWLRSAIIWHKSNPMPESGQTRSNLTFVRDPATDARVKCDCGSECAKCWKGWKVKGCAADRPTKSHEFVFLLTKSARCFWDAEAVRTPLAAGPNTADAPTGDYNTRRVLGEKTDGEWTRTKPPSRKPGWTGPRSGANLRDVWTIPTQAFKKAHFATFPQKLVEPCVKAGTSEKGCCPECGTPWVRVVDRERKPTRPGENTKIKVPGGWDTKPGAHSTIHREGRSEPEYREVAEIGNRDPGRHVTECRTLGWKSGCECGGKPMPYTVLDPFAGSGTVGVVCKQMGLDFIGIELNPDYCKMARQRIANPQPEPEIPDVEGQAYLFEVAE